ncbi:MAG: Rpn family recombination-promoting nuclease/putative transposase [Planctomycetes bacterium]|nr:Rpn family recombination-promoting nuclease/putative transposase [Planctomycetota bacterium]
MQSPHDQLFHFTFRHAAHAASWLRSIAPPELRAAIDWSTLAAADDRLPGLWLRPHLADRVFVAARRDDSCLVLILVEHKSHPDPEVQAQLLRYAVLLRRVFQQRHGALPSLLAVVLQHGRSTRPGREAPAAHDPLAAWQPTVRLLVDDLTTGAAALLERDGLTALTRLTLLCLSHLPHLAPDQVPGAFTRWQSLLRAVDRCDAPPDTPPLGPDAIDAIGWYTLAVTDVTPEDLSGTFGRILHRPEDTIMSTLERTYQKGKAEGKAEGRAETLLRMLHRRFGPLDAAIEQRVRGGSSADLDAWTDRILDAPTLTAVLDG